MDEEGEFYSCRSAATLEWGFTYWLVKDEEALATKGHFTHETESP